MWASHVWFELRDRVKNKTIMRFKHLKFWEYKGYLDKEHRGIDSGYDFALIKFKKWVFPRC